MKQGILIFWLAIWVQVSVSQSLMIAPSVIEDIGYDEIMVAGYTPKGYFLLQSNLPFETDRDRIGFKNRKFRISFFNEKIIRQWHQNVEADPDHAVVQAVFFTGNKMTALNTVLAKSGSGGELSLFLKHYSDDGTISQTQAAGKVQLTTVHEKIRVIVSENRQLTGILIPEFINDETLRVHFMVYDSAFNPMISKSLSISCQRKNFIMEDYILSNNGALAILSVEQVRESGSRKRLDQYKIHLCEAAGSDFYEKVVSRDQTETAGAGIIFDNLSNRLVCAGFMADASLSSNTSVFMHFIPVQNTGAAFQRIIPVDEQYKFKLAAYQDKRESGLFSYPIRKLILRNDGGLVLIAEAYYTYEYSYYDYFTQSYMRRMDYQFNNIVSISIHPDGAIHWLNVIRKTQESTDDGGVFSSFLQMTTDNDLIMIYNTDNGRENEVRYSLMDASGKFEESKVIRNQNPVVLMPRFGKQVSANESVVPCYSRKKLSLAKIIF